MGSTFKFELDSIKENAISILVTGDMFPALLRKANKLSKVVEIVYHKDILELLHNKDISLTNLECPLTTIDQPISKQGLNISAPPETIEILRTAKFDIAVLANNHIMDNGSLALEETVSVCEKNGLKTVGVGPNIEVACSPLFVETERYELAILAFAEEEFSCASKRKPGAAKLDLTVAKSVIQSAKKESSLVIVSVHGGNEFYPIPSPRVQKWYRFLVECGADAVIGHHPHTIQGIEIYRGVPIIYSLGNFVFPAENKRPKCWHEGLIAKLSLSSNKVCGIEMFPCEQILSDGKVEIKLMRGTTKDRFTKRFERLTQIANDRILAQKFWECFCLHKMKFYVNILKMGALTLDGGWLYPLKNMLSTGNINYFSSLCGDLVRLCQRKSTKQQQLLRLRNFLFCPAHYDVLSTIVEMKRLAIEPEPEIMDEFKRLITYCS